MGDIRERGDIPRELAELEDTLVSSRSRDGDEPLATASLSASLVVVAHPDDTCLGKRYVLDRSRSYVVGRSLDVDISFPTVPELSREQARIEWKNDAFRIADLDSTNGTFVNRRLAQGSTPLRSGDRIDCDQITFKFLEGADDEQVYHDAIYDLVMKDDLTGIFNRRKFEEQIDRDFARSRRHVRPLTLVLFDVDEFKSINDAFGHPFGDHVLIEIAKLCEKSLRKEEIFSRVGGDEFVILCPEVTAAEAKILAERLRNAVASHHFVVDDKHARVSCSFGVCERTSEMKTSEDLYVATDELLYQSKAQGRNRVTASCDLVADHAADD